MATNDAPYPTSGKFRVKPAVIEAEQWNGSYAVAARYIERYGPSRFVVHSYVQPNFLCLTANGSWATINPGDWILFDSDGHPYPCTDSVFRAKYEPAE